MTAKSEANKALAELYKEHTGLTKGPVIKALSEMNNELGITDPYLVPVQNHSEHDIESIPPNGLGVVPVGRLGKRLKRVKIVSKADGEPAKRAKGSAKEDKE